MARNMTDAESGMVHPRLFLHDFIPNHPDAV